MKNNFITCGLTGWCMEIVFTSIHAVLKKDYRLIGKTSLWMFPIYGLAAIIKPVSRLIKKKPPLIRGGIYCAGILFCEYISGSILKKDQLCPWDYSHANTNIHGVIRLDYIPYWMAVGLFFEWLLNHSDQKNPHH